MTTIADIYKSAVPIINRAIQKEIVDQGHHLTGALEESLFAEASLKGKSELMEGFAVHYAQFVNDGFPAASASMSQFPFLLEYFTKRGFPVFSSTDTVTAAQMAAMTIKKWMREGMPTQASKRFSKTGSRVEMVQSAFVGAAVEIDDHITQGLDFVVEEQFQKEKSGKV